MTAWRVRASLLDALYWHWRTGADDEKLRARIAQAQPENAAMRRGTAIHAALEHRNPFEHWQSDEFVVAFDEADPGDLPFGADRLPFPADEDRREVTVQREIGDVLFTGHVDLLGDGFIVDYKTSTRKPKWRNHSDSWQWRAYCLICGVDRAVYRHYQYRVTKKAAPVRLSVMLPEDHDFHMDVGDDDLLEAGRAIVAQAERLDCAGAVMLSRHLAVSNLKHAQQSVAGSKATRDQKAFALIGLLRAALVTNEIGDEAEAVATKLRSLRRPQEKALGIALSELEGTL